MKIFQLFSDEFVSYTFYIDLEVSFLSILKIKSIDSYFDKWCVYQYLSVCYMKLSVFGLIKLERTRKVIFFYGRPR